MEVSFHKPYITEEEVSEVVDSLRSGWLTMGPKTESFEEEFRKYIGSKHAVALNSCTAALHLALEAVGLKEKDEVLVPAMTFTATAEVVCYFKARPVFVDVRKDTLNIDASRLEENIARRTKAIIPVHYGGQPADLDTIKENAGKYKLFVIEDAAHSLPSWYKKRKVGTISDMTCFSFYATKTLAAGEGGMITTDNQKWAGRIKIMRLHGMNSGSWKRYCKEGKWFYKVVSPGYKYNTTDIQAALGICQLRKLEFMWQRRKEIARKYNEAFENMEEIFIPYIKENRETSWHLYVIKLNLRSLKINRDRFIEELKRKEVNASVHFIPLYRHPFYRKIMIHKKDKFPNSEWAYKRIISLPIYPSMGDSEINKVIDAVKDTVRENRR